MIRKLCTTDDKTAAVILRLVLGVVFSRTKRRRCWAGSEPTWWRAALSAGSASQSDNLMSAKQVIWAFGRVVGMACASFYGKERVDLEN
jgi:hypothetical protein